MIVAHSHRGFSPVRTCEPSDQPSQRLPHSNRTRNPAGFGDAVIVDDAVHGAGYGSDKASFITGASIAVDGGKLAG